MKRLFHSERFATWTKLMSSVQRVRGFILPAHIDVFRERSRRAAPADSGVAEHRCLEMDVSAKRVPEERCDLYQPQRLTGKRFQPAAHTDDRTIRQLAVWPTRLRTDVMVIAAGRTRRRYGNSRPTTRRRGMDSLAHGRQRFVL